MSTGRSYRRAERWVGTLGSHTCPWPCVAHAQGRSFEKLRKKGLDVKPLEIEGRKIARTFWGQAWCDHLESFSDYRNRLPRGRTYVRNGSVCHLDIARGVIDAMVSGSRLYTVKITIRTLPRKKWEAVKNRCAGKIGSLVELLQGRFSGNVMSVVTDRTRGLFPLPGEISLKCSCPDWAVMCKHVAAVLYGVGARLDEEPELLFLLRGVDHGELIDAEFASAACTPAAGHSRRRIADADLADVFDIEMTDDEMPDGRKHPPGLKGDVRSSKSKKAPKIPVATRKRSRKAAGGTKQKPRKKAAGTRRASEAASSSRPVTGRVVAGLRRKFGMSQSEFARLLGVSVPSVWNWERKPGPLRLQKRTRKAWNEAKKLTKRQAWRRLGG